MINRVSEKLNKILAAASNRGNTGEILWRMRSDDGSLDYTFGDPNRPFFIASATKLYVTAILAQLRAEGVLDWDSSLSDLLPHLPLRDLLGNATVREVMAHTSGLADYFEGSRRVGLSTFDRVIDKDFSWNVNDVITWTVDMKPAVRGKGLYSDTGYQLLGALIEKLDGCTFTESLHTRISQRIGLDNTYCFSPETLSRYSEVAPLMHGDHALNIPLAMASVRADGGIVSTSRDSLIFIDAFFGGELFPTELLSEMETDWHSIFRPLEYGTGVMRFKLPRLMTGFRRVPPFVGHSGASGTVMFRCPDYGLTIVGTVNQTKKRSLPYQLMVRTSLAV